VGVASTGTEALALTVTNSPITTSGTIDIQPNLFTSTAPGVVPQSGGGTANFLRADATWVTVPNLTGSNTWTNSNSFPQGDFFLSDSGGGLVGFTTTNSGAGDYTITFNAITSTVMAYIYTGTVSGLPAASTANRDMWAVVTDATSPTYNGTLTGGGTVRVPVYSNGTAWTSH
jgi:hypothetical protein